MPYEIRPEDDTFAVYENDEYCGILSCPFEQTAEEFVKEMKDAGYQLLTRSEIANIDEFADSPELSQWDVFAIDPEPDTGEEEDGREDR